MNLNKLAFNFSGDSDTEKLIFFMEIRAAVTACCVYFFVSVISWRIIVTNQNTAIVFLKAADPRALLTRCANATSDFCRFGPYHLKKKQQYYA